VRLMRTGELDREPTEDGQYRYFSHAAAQTADPYLEGIMRRRK
jgi:hypothetical protein